ncbi:MAG: 4Fe-4S binding protein [Actinobacteria bacterium]|nr:4Fe-4S binding protein [Actinomycetota bacterium]
MPSKRLVLTFPENIVTKPITYKLVKDFNLEFNILRAEVTPEMEGKMLLEIKGASEQIEKGIEYLLNEGVSVQEASKDITLDKEQCVHCGLCVSLCITNALSLDEKSYKLNFNKEKCILCGFCQNSCPVNAIKLKM